MYTVSAHVPMGENVGATPDGRYAKEPLADGAGADTIVAINNDPNAEIFQHANYGIVGDCMEVLNDMLAHLK